MKFIWPVVYAVAGYFGIEYGRTYLLKQKLAKMNPPIDYNAALAAAQAGFDGVAGPGVGKVCVV